MRAALLILCNLIGFFIAQAQPLVLRDAKNYELVADLFVGYSDTTNRMELREVCLQKFSAYNQLGPSRTRSTFWYKCDLVDSSGEDKDWFLVFYKHDIDSIYLYVMSGDAVLMQKYYSVHQTTMSQRDIPYKNFVVDFKIPKNKKVSILLKSNDRISAYYGYSLKEHSYYFSYAQTETFWFGLFYGGMLLLILYHLSFLWSLRDMAYLYYTLYILFQSLYMAYRDGMVVPLLFPEIPGFVHPVFSLLMVLLSIALILYCRNFVKLNSYVFYDWIVRIYIPLRLLAYIVKPTYNELHVVLDYIPVVISFMFSLISVFQKQKTSYWLCLGFAFLLASHVINSLWRNNIIVCTPPVFYSMYVGLFIEAMLLAFANSFRLHTLRKDSIIKLELENLKIKDELKINHQESIIVDQKEQIDNFLYRASHDIKGPLKSIDGLSRLGQIDPTHTLQYFSKIQVMTKRLQKILDNFLEVVRNNNSPAKIESIELNDLVEECVEEQFADYPGRASVTIRYEIPETFILKSEFYSLYSVIQNLVENSIKYQDSSKEESYILIRAFLENSSPVIIIEDNGQGIRNESMTKIFTMFYRANIGNSEGVGMGLYIVKRALERINATVRIESEEGKYSRFIIKL